MGDLAPQSNVVSPVTRRQMLNLMGVTGAIFLLPRYVSTDSLLTPPRKRALMSPLDQRIHQSSNDPLCVMTYNVWGIPTSADRAARMVAIGRELATMNLDIVGLQECWLKADRDRILDGIAGSGLRYTHFYPSGFMGSGLMILSRFPIVDVGFHRYTLNGLPLMIPEVDYYGGKGIGFARLDTPNGEIAVFNTHIIARYNEEDIFHAHRAAQAYEFAQYVNTHAGDRPVIALGDFNFGPRNIGYRLISQLTGLANAFETVHGSESEFNRYIDHVFTRNGNTHALAPTRAQIAMQHAPPESGLQRLSDHEAVLAELTPSESSSINYLNESDHTAILEELLGVFEQGIIGATARRKQHFVKILLSGAVFLSAEIAGNRVPEDRILWRWVLRVASRLIAAPVNIAQGLMVRIATPDEINALTHLAQEVRIQLGR